MAYCMNCKSTLPIRVVTRYVLNNKTAMYEKIEQCDRCDVVADQVPRDAMGNKVIGYPDGYSYATDSVHTSKREFSEHLKSHDLIQKDGAFYPGGKKWK